MCAIFNPFFVFRCRSNHIPKTSPLSPVRVCQNAVQISNMFTFFKWNPCFFWTHHYEQQKIQQYQRNNITCRPRWRCLSTELHPWPSHLRPGNVFFFAGELDVHIILGQILPLVDQNSSSRQIKSEGKIDIKSCQDKFFVESPLVFHYLNLNLFILFFFLGCNETW